MNRLSATRPIFLLTIVCAALLALSCGGIASFSFTEESQVVTVEGSVVGQDDLPVENPFGEPLRLRIDLDQELERRDASGAKEVNLSELVLEITEESEGQDFDFLESLELSADADGLEERRVAIIEDVPEGRSRIELETDDEADLKPYIEEGMRLEASAEGNQPDDDTDLRAVATIFVRVL